MDSNNKRASGSQVQRVAFAENMKSVYTCIPGHVLAFDPVKQRAQIQIGIQRSDIDGTTWVPAPIVDVPVCFPGDDFVVEYQIDPGCEGIVMFSQRCIDGWKQTGGTADNPVARFHNQQDAMFVPGIRSLPNVITNFSNNGIKLRDKAGTQYAWLKNDQSLAFGNANGAINIAANGAISFTNASGNVQLTQDGKFIINGIEFGTHKHTGVQSGGSTSGGPTN